jgi:hypothetical protein
VIPQTAWEKSRHERTDSEADAEPLAVCRASEGGGSRLWSPKCEKAFSLQPSNDDLETVRRDRQKCVRAIAPTPPDLFNERKIGVPVLEMNEFAVTLRRFIQIRALGHSRLWSFFPNYFGS